MGIARGTHLRELGLALIALALALRILIAPGFMPLVAGGAITVSMCTGQGVVEVAAPGKAPLHKAVESCPYWALASLPTVPPVALLTRAMDVWTAAIVPAVPAVERPHIGAPAPPPPQTGPPFTR